MKFRYFTIVSLIIASSFGIRTDVYASDSLKTNKTIWQNLGGDIVTSLKDAGAYVTSPLRFSGRDWLYTGGIVATIGVVMATDKEVRQRLGRNTTSSTNRDFWDVPTYYGNALYAGVFSAAFYTTGLFSGNDWIRTTGRLLIEGLAFAGSVDVIVKYITGRQRPYASESQWNYKWFQTNNDNQSFPSGHSTVAFAVSTVLAERIDNNIARAGLYGLAGLTAIARVVNNQHWLSDVVSGGLLGFCSGYFVVHREQEREKGTTGATHFSIYPSLNGLSAAWSF